MSLLRLARNIGSLAKTSIKVAGISPKDVCIASPSFAPSQLIRRELSLSSALYCEPEKPHLKYNKPGRDRSEIVPVETSIEYMKSDAYDTTYGDNPVWFGYRRVHKGGIAPRLTRESCVRFKVVTTSSPCPICRDEYLILDHRNLDLLKQFVSPHTGEVSVLADGELINAKIVLL